MDLRQHFFKNVALLRMACRRTCARPGRSVLCLAGPRAAPPAGVGQRLAKDRIMTDHCALRLAGKVLPPPIVAPARRQQDWLLPSFASQVCKLCLVGRRIVHAGC